METTTNYGLKKPAQSDFVNVEDINYNSDILDEKLSEAEQKAEDAKVTVTHDTENEALCISLNEENVGGGIAKTRYPIYQK